MKSYIVKIISLIVLWITLLEGSLGLSHAQDIWKMQLLKTPVYRSLRYEKVNVRVGPGSEYPVKFVFTRQSLPVQVTATYGYWCKIIDLEGDEGWVDRALLSSTSTALVVSSVAPLYKSEENHTMIATLEKGFVVVVDRCNKGFCAVHAASYGGVVPIKMLWGDLHT